MSDSHLSVSGKIPATHFIEELHLQNVQQLTLEPEKIRETFEFYMKYPDSFGDRGYDFTFLRELVGNRQSNVGVELLHLFLLASMYPEVTYSQLLLVRDYIELPNGTGWLLMKLCIQSVKA